MNAEQKGAEGITRLLNLLKGLVEVRDDLEKLGSIKAATAEAQTRLDVTLKEEAQAASRLANNISSAEDDKHQAAEALRAAEIQADKIVDDAKAKAAEILNDAKADART